MSITTDIYIFRLRNSSRALLGRSAKGAAIRQGYRDHYKQLALKKTLLVLVKLSTCLRALSICEDVSRAFAHVAATSEKFTPEGKHFYRSSCIFRIDGLTLSPLSNSTCHIHLFSSNHPHCLERDAWSRVK